MKFNVFRKGCVSSKVSDGLVSLQSIISLQTDAMVDKFRQRKDDAVKRYIPAFCPMGICDTDGIRVARTMKSNNLCMVDLDHISVADFAKLKEKIIEQKDVLSNMQFCLVYITCSGWGYRFVFPLFDGLDIAHSQLAFVKIFFPDFVKYLDTCTTDISRLSILTKRSDYLIVKDSDSDSVGMLEIGDKKLLEEIKAIKDIKSYVQNAKAINNGTGRPTDEGSAPILRNNDSGNRVNSIDDANAASLSEKDGSQGNQDGEKSERDSVSENEVSQEKSAGSSTDANADADMLNPDGIDIDNVAYKDYSIEKIQECDKIYSEYPYKGRKVRELANAYIQYKTHGRGPDKGERHALYGLLCTNFRNLCNNDPRILHAVLPDTRNDGMSTILETWKQCVWAITHSRTSNLPKEFYFWCKDNGFLDWPAEDETSEESEEDKMYEMFLKKMPPLPPIIREYVKIAPKWFKLPVLASLQCYTALLSTNHRTYYFDGSPISTTLYTLIYAPAASGKSYTRKLRNILKRIEQRDKLALEKAKWYDRQQRQNNGSGKLPEEVVWKQQLFSSKTSMGEVLKRQEAIGEHHWLQDIAEFSIWAATVKKAKEEWSAFFRTSYDNEEFSQSYQSANAYRGKVAVYPIVHGTCTFGQISSFFTNVEDGLLTRFSFVPLMHQRYASYQPWKLMSDRDQAIVEKTIKRLEWETYCDVEDEPEEVDEEIKTNEDGEEVKVKKDTTKNDRGEWDYDFKEPIYHEMEYVHEALLQWLEHKRLEALKDDNEALDTFRRRCARNAMAYALICRALWGRNDQRTRDKIVANAIFDAEVKLYYMRYVWESTMNEELKQVKSPSKRLTNQPLYDKLPNIFSKEKLHQAMMSGGYKTPVGKMISIWKLSGFLKEVGKSNYQKINP